MTSRNNEADRSPNWGKWQLIPNPELWQCIALSLNIDPDKVRRGSRYRMAGDRIFNESQEFKDRMDVVGANLSRKGSLNPKSIAMGSPSYCTLDLRQFALWVRQIEWAAPPELLAMADERPQGIDWNYWTALDLWPLDAACKIVCGCSPSEPTRCDDTGNPDTLARPAWVNVYHTAVSAIKAGNLRVVDGEVTPAEFIAWVQGKGIPIAGEVAQFAPCPVTDRRADAATTAEIVDEHDPAEQNRPTPGDKNENTGRRTRNKRETEARHREWQEGINKLAQDSPGKSHADYCRTLSKQINVSFQTIRRNTKLGHS